MPFAQKRKRTISVLAHRGQNVTSPENTLLAYSKAIELDADYIEIDVRLCADDYLVVSHDADLKKTADIDKKIRDLTLKQLKEIDLGQGQNVPTLEEVLQLCKNRIGIHIEIKEDGLTQDIAHLVIKHQMQDQVIFSSFKHRELLEIKKHLPNIPTAILCPSEKYDPETIPMQEIYNNIISKAKKYKVQGIHLEIMYIEQTIVEMAHKRGYWLNAFNVDSFFLWDACLEMGVDGIFTNNAKGLIEHLSKKQI